MLFDSEKKMHISIVTNVYSIGQSFSDFESHSNHLSIFYHLLKNASHLLFIVST